MRYKSYRAVATTSHDHTMLLFSPTKAISYQCLICSGEHSRLQFGGDWNGVEVLFTWSAYDKNHIEQLHWLFLISRWSYYHQNKPWSISVHHSVLIKRHFRAKSHDLTHHPNAHRSVLANCNVQWYVTSSKEQAITTPTASAIDQTLAKTSQKQPLKWRFHLSVFCRPSTIPRYEISKSVHDDIKSKSLMRFSLLSAR